MEITGTWKIRENFVFATLVFVHFAFAALNFDILFLSCQLLVIHHKMKMLKFCFVFFPTLVVLLLFFATQKGKSKMSKLRVAKIKWAKTKYSWNITNHVVLIPPKNYANIRSRLIVNRWWKLKRRFRVFM